jgi:hypothetical protein
MKSVSNKLNNRHEQASGNAGIRAGGRDWRDDAGG